MAGLQRSSGTFRRSGSSGKVWDDDRHLSGEIVTPSPGPGRLDGDGPPARPVQRSRSTGHAGYRASAGRVSPALDLPSTRVGVCGFCGLFRGGNTKKKATPKKIVPKARRASG